MLVALRLSVFCDFYSYEIPSYSSVIYSKSSMIISIENTR